MVPCPAMVRRSSYGGTSVAPVRSHVVERRLGRQIVGGSAHDQLNEFPAVVADPVALLSGRLGRHIHAAVHAQRPARIREALRVVTRRGAHHAGGNLLVGQLHQQVVGATQLVGAHDLQVFAFEVDLRAGDLRQPIAELQRGGRDHRSNPLRRVVNVSRGQRLHLRGARATGSVQRTPINGATCLTLVRRLSSPESARTPESGGRSFSGSRRSRARPRLRAPTRWPSRRRTPRGRRNRG